LIAAHSQVRDEAARFRDSLVPNRLPQIRKLAAMKSDAPGELFRVRTRKLERLCVAIVRDHKSGCEPARDLERVSAEPCCRIEVHALGTNREMVDRFGAEHRIMHMSS